LNLKKKKKKNAKNGLKRIPPPAPGVLAALLPAPHLSTALLALAAL
jgi:hypothetical protein